jgi:hypothetical protein
MTPIIKSVELKSVDTKDVQKKESDEELAKTFFSKDPSVIEKEKEKEKEEGPRPSIAPPTVIERKLLFPDLAWKAIKDIDTEAFSMPNQPISCWAEPVADKDTDKLTLFIKTSALVQVIRDLIPRDKFKVINERNFILKSKQGTAFDIISIESDMIEPVKVENSEIWLDIRNIDLQMYGMINQFVQKYFIPLSTNKSNTVLLFTDNQLAANTFKTSLPLKYIIDSEKSFVYKQRAGVLIEIILGDNSNE